MVNLSRNKLERHVKKSSLYAKNRYNETKTENSLETNKYSKDLIEKLDLKNNNTTYYLNRLDDYEGLFSTQQLTNLDFSKFENHIFFDSAVEKVNYSFKKIINDFPYDKTEFEFDQYIKGLDGYTDYILKNVIPSNIGYFNFDKQTYVNIIDQNGTVFKDNDKLLKGILNPDLSKFSFDFWINPRYEEVEGTNPNNQIVYQKYNSAKKELIAAYIENKNNDDKTCYLVKIVSNESSYVSQKIEIEYGTWSHIHISIKNVDSKRKIYMYLNCKLIKSSNTGSLIVKKFSDAFSDSDFNFGGSPSRIFVHKDLDITFNFYNGFLDDFKYYKRILTQKEMVNLKNTGAFAEDLLCLYIRFNEISGAYSYNYVVLDSSGNKLHGKILNASDNSIVDRSDINTRGLKIAKSSSDNHIKYEIKHHSPVIFPDYETTVTNQVALLAKAEKYDLINPNIFWKLMPKQLFIESSDSEGLEDSLTDSSKYTMNGIKITTPANNTLIRLMLVWSRFFDELKTYVDNFTEILNISYDDFNKTDTLGLVIPLAVKEMGFEFKHLLPSALSDKLNGLNLTHEDVRSEKTIRYIQNELWKRLLLNSQDIIRTKGTQHSVRSAFNIFGIQADKFVSIREYSGKNKLNMYENDIQKTTTVSFVDFGSLPLIHATPEYTDDNFYNNNNFLLEIEETSKKFEFENDWSLELFCNFDKLKLLAYNNTQNIIRLDRKLIDVANKRAYPLINLYFKREKNNVDFGSLCMEVLDQDSTFITDATEDTYTLQEKKVILENINLMNGSDFYISIKKSNINNSPSIQQGSNASIDTNQSKYTLTVSQSEFPYLGQTKKSASVYCNYTSLIEKEIKENIDCFRIGDTNTLGYSRGNLTIAVNDITTTFQGKVSNIKLWSKEITGDEEDERIKNPNSIGDIDPLYLDRKNEIFEPSNVSSKYYLKYTLDLYKDSIDLTNTSIEYDNILNIQEPAYNQFKTIIKCNVKLSSLFTSIDSIVGTKDKIFSVKNIKFDEPVSSNNININSFNSEYFKNKVNNKNINPSYRTSYDFEYQNDLRFSIDFSQVKFINDDINKILTTNKYFSDMLGKSSSLYDYEYTKISKLRELYFDRLSQQISYTPLYQLYKYFDNILEDILTDTVPDRVNYLGFNFVCESHALERHKYEYKMSESRIPVIDNSYNFTRPKSDGLLEFRNFINIDDSVKSTSTSTSEE